MGKTLRREQRKNKDKYKQGREDRKNKRAIPEEKKNADSRRDEISFGYDDNYR